ncbi:MAG: isochorismatase family protein [Flavobacteriales bacterium]|nr:isochorismatase family protein [Flavobacteriales bacterium]
MNTKKQALILIGFQNDYFAEDGITDVVIAGVVCSICIDSTRRSAFERGYKITMLNDCISGRTVFEQKFYCENVFPLYDNVIDSKSFLRELTPQKIEV